MGIDGDTLAQIRKMLRPLATRMANAAARAIVTLVDDSKKLQLVQLGVLAGETLDEAEHHQPYGFSSVPLEGAEAIVVFPNGDRAHALVLVASDRRHRPTGGAAGEVILYNNANARVILKANGTIEARSASGTAVALATKADIDALITTFNSHVHTGVTTGGGSSGSPATPAASAVGTTKLKGE